MPTRNPLRVGLVGVKADGVSAVHQDIIEVLEKEGLVKLVAVAENDHVRNKAVLDRHNSRGVRIFNDYERMALTCELDAVTVATPHFTHVPIALTFLHNETGVFLEKPPAVTVQSGLGLSQAYNSGTGFIGTNYMYTASQSARELRQALFHGAIGEIEKIVCIGKWMRSNEYFQGRSWAGKKMVGDQACIDGCLNNQFPHLLNQAVFFASKNAVPTVKSVLAELYRAHRKEVLEMEDTASLKARVNNIDIFLYCTTCNPQDDPVSLTIYGERGIATWDFTMKDTGYSISLYDKKTEPIVKRYQEDWGSMCLGMYRNFITSMLGEDQLYWDIDQALATTAIVNGAYESARGIWQIHPDFTKEYASEGGGESSGIKTDKPQTKVTLCPEIMEGFGIACERNILLSDTGYMHVQKPESHTVNLVGYRNFKLSILD